MSGRRDGDDDAFFLPLTKRERDVLSFLARGASAKWISHLLGLSARTVEIHAASIIRKFRARNRVHAVALAVHAGFVRPDLPLGRAVNYDGEIAIPVPARGDGHDARNVDAPAAGRDFDPQDGD